jgi:hypothetical protein
MTAWMLLLCGVVTPPEDAGPSLLILPSHRLAFDTIPQPSTPCPLCHMCERARTRTRDGTQGLVRAGCMLCAELHPQPRSSFLSDDSALAPRRKLKESVQKPPPCLLSPSHTSSTVLLLFFKW